MTSLRKKYDALGNKLQVLETITIPPTVWKALEAGSNNHFNRAYRGRLPIVVAQFRQAATKEIMQWAKRQEITIRREQEIPLEAIQGYKHDIELLDATLFRKQELYFDFDIGKFTEAKVSGRLHEDGDGERSARVYITRLGALPTYAIHGGEIEALPSSKKQQADALIARALKYATCAADRRQIGEAKKQLIDLGYLKPIPLGAVALMVHQDSMNGTLHSASDLINDGPTFKPVHSAFLRAITL